MKAAGILMSPKKWGVVHIIGIGGIGMSGIAEILHTYGYEVQGSDMSSSYMTERLKSIGIKVFIGHKAEHVEKANIVVRSTAVNKSNPEIIEASARNIPTISRSEMLAELLRFKHAIAISGTHGKTTTTSLVGAMLMSGGMNPTIINGGIINAVGSNVHIGNGDFIVVEADESDGTFIRLPSCISIITNIDPEHLDYYGSFDNAKAAYLKFMQDVPFYGFFVACFDHEIVREISSKVTNRRCISYGIDYNSDIMAKNININTDGSTFDVILSENFLMKSNFKSKKIEKLFLPTHGLHNIRNSLAAIATAIALEIEEDAIRKALLSFAGVKRRFTKVAEINDILIVDDYAHHPVEISATLSAASEIAKIRGGNIIAVMQPHRYSRLSSLMDDFSICMNQADQILVTDVYPAGEEKLDGVNSEILVEKIKKTGFNDVIYVNNHKNIAHTINTIAKPKDLIVFLGAGNITQWAYELPDELMSLS